VHCTSERRREAPRAVIPPGGFLKETSLYRFLDLDLQADLVHYRYI
jgi:hypothetical protein